MIRDSIDSTITEILAGLRSSRSCIIILRIILEQMSVKKDPYQFPRGFQINILRMIKILYKNYI